MVSDKQTYDTYYKDYFAGKGRKARRKAENKYRARLRKEDLKTSETSLEQSLKPKNKDHASS